MAEKLDPQKWREAFAIRVWNLSQYKEPIVVRENDKVIFEFDVGKLLTVSSGKLTIELGQPGLKTKGNLVGMSGTYYALDLFWGGTIENVVHSWNWLIERLNLDAEQFQTVIEAEAILELLATGQEEGLLFHLLSLAVDLHELDSEGIDVESKISELGKHARAHLRKYEKLKDNFAVQALFKIGALRFYMANVSSESRLARLAKEWGHDVKLGKHPDLIIDGKGLEVKRARTTHRLASLLNLIKKGLKQKVDLIAIQVVGLDKREIKGIKTTWLATDRLSSVLKSSLTHKGKCVLLFCGTNRGYFGRIILLK